MREVLADAPGRVNLIGDHTDYQEGFVLTCAVPQRTTVRLRVRPDMAVHLDTPPGNGAAAEYRLGAEAPGLGWADYVQGLTMAVARDGASLRGFDVMVHSDVPAGSGLSSTAALAVAVLRALRAAFDLTLSDIDIARLGERAAVDFVGAPPGITELMASSLAGEREALFLDARTLMFNRIPLPYGLDLVVIDSGIRAADAAGGGGAYPGANEAVRRGEAERAASLLGVHCLRDVTLEELPRLASLPAVLARRARHVITENARVLAACRALRSADLPALGRLFAASHASMRDDYEVSVPGIDRLVAIAIEDSDVYGARLTGGGCGGSSVVAASAGTSHEVAARIVTTCGSHGARPKILVPPGVFIP
jgi:galactokinase